MKKFRLASNILAILLYLGVTIFFICLAISLPGGEEGSAEDAISGVVFLIMTIGIGALLYLAPLLSAIASLVITIKLNKTSEVRLSTTLSKVMIVLPIVTEVILSIYSYYLAMWR